MSDETAFPSALIELQERLHRAHAEHRAYLAGLPRYSHRGDVPDSPGWTDEQETVDRMWVEIRQLSIEVADHPHWKTVPADLLMSSRMQLKRQARPAEFSEAAGAA
ncbi:hypothetical protein ACFWP3_02240 [Streptomyces sp. NPDC058525]|uniref:hypothetical protein n=1 Tax=Streptomyces sp. NPDC058525 TaxID=3346538 RepID=UPI00365DE6AE